MPDIFDALNGLASQRESDPLAPSAVIVPSHAAGLHLRRRLAELGPFAAVRFETLARIAELLAAGHLAAAGRAPLARPIGDYVAERVALDSRGPLQRVANLPGYARALRRIFRRLRRGGIRSSAMVNGGFSSGQFAEILRLYDKFRGETERFYDDEDLLDAAASIVIDGRAQLLDLGEIIAVPPGAQSAGAAALLAALARKSSRFVELDEPSCVAEARFVLAPDPASEVREVVREIISALEDGVPVHEVAVFHGAGRGYARLLREVFDASGIPVVPLPGIPLIETRAGRGVLGLAQLPAADFSRAKMIDVFSIAPLRSWLPAGDDQVRALPAAWDRVSREAGITKGSDHWNKALIALEQDLKSSIEYHEAGGNEARARSQGHLLEQARDLREVAELLVSRMTPLSKLQPASQLIEEFAAIVEEYFDPDDKALPDVMGEIQQLGTVGAVGGSFTLAAFAEALRANLEAAYVRPLSLGSGVAVSDYRAAAGLRFKRVILCGAHEGSLPAGPGPDALTDDRVWTALREHHPFIEDAAARIARNRDDALRAVRAAGDGTVLWTAPLREPGGTREYYPSLLMREASSTREATIRTASDLRNHRSSDGWLRRGRSPLAIKLAGPIVTREEAAYRWAIDRRRAGDLLAPQHHLWPTLSMLRARRSPRFTAWDGNLVGLEQKSWLELNRAVSPTSLENYAVCGFRYFAKSVLGLYPVEEPEERDMMDAAARGSLIHDILHRFFRDQKERGRPQPQEAWTPEDTALLIRMADDALAAAEERGLTGLGVYSAHEARTIKADLRRFLEEDTLFRQETGAVPADLEAAIPEQIIEGATLKGFVDRVDITPDRRSAWVIDYKSGSVSDFEEIKPDDPLAGGKKLQLPVYSAAAPDAEKIHALYWFITQKGGYKRVEYAPSQEQRDAFPRTLKAILTGIRAGSFPAVPGEDSEYYGKFENCKYCDYDRICSRRRDLEMASKREDEAVSPWRAVKPAATGEEST